MFREMLRRLAEPLVDYSEELGEERRRLTGPADHVARAPLDEALRRVGGDRLPLLEHPAQELIEEFVLAQAKVFLRHVTPPRQVCSACRSG